MNLPTDKEIFLSNVRTQLSYHPRLQPMDMIKFLYQSTFGAEHLLKETDYAKRMFDEEWEQTPANNQPLTEPLFQGYVRVNIGACKFQNLDKNVVWTAFWKTATVRSGKDDTYFWKLTDWVTEAFEQLPFAFSKDEWTDTVQEYMNNGVVAVHHSQMYRTLYQPAYRVIQQEVFQK